MYLIACGIILSLGIFCNRKDSRMLALTALVGASIYVPAPDLYTQFYVFCIAAEILVALLALVLNTAGTLVVVELCVLLVIAHVMGYSLDGSPPFSPYRMIVKILEFSQLTACVALSPVVSPILRNHDAKT